MTARSERGETETNATVAELERAYDTATDRVNVLEAAIDRANAPFEARIETVRAEFETVRAEWTTATKGLVEEFEVAKARRGDASHRLDEARTAAGAAYWAVHRPRDLAEAKRFVEAHKELGSDGYDTATYAVKPLGVQTRGATAKRLDLVTLTDREEPSAVRKKVYLAFDRKDLLVGWMRLDIDGHRGGSTNAEGRVGSDGFLRQPVSRTKDERGYVYRRETHVDLWDVKEPLAQFLNELGVGKALTLAPLPGECRHGHGRSGQMAQDGSETWTCSDCDGVVGAPEGNCLVCGNRLGSGAPTDVRGHMSHWAYGATVARIADHDAVPSKGAY